MKPEHNFSDGSEEIFVEEREKRRDTRSLLSALILSFILTLVFISVTALSNIIWAQAARIPVSDVLGVWSAPAYVRALSRTVIFILSAIICKSRGTLTKNFNICAQVLPLAALLGVALQIAGVFILNPAVFMDGSSLGTHVDLGNSALFQYFLVSVIFSPLAEELLFRGVIYRELRNVSPKSWVIPALISSALFALSHAPITLIVIAFASGIVFAFCTECTGSVVPAVISHSLFNASAYFLWVFPFTGMLSKVILFALSLIIVLVSLIVFRRFGFKKKNKQKGL